MVVVNRGQECKQVGSEKLLRREKELLVGAQPKPMDLVQEHGEVEIDPLNVDQDGEDPELTMDQSRSLCQQMEVKLLRREEDMLAGAQPNPVDAEQGEPGAKTREIGQAVETRRLT